MTEGTNRFGRQEDAKNSKALNEYASSKSDPPNKEQRVWFCVEPTLNHTPSLPILLVGSISKKSIVSVDINPLWTRVVVSQEVCPTTSVKGNLPLGVSQKWVFPTALP